MKKHAFTAISAFVLLFAVLPILPASAAGTVNISLSASPSTARPGDTVTVSVKLKGVASAGGVAAGGVTITYDTAKLFYQSAAIGGGKPAADLDINASGSMVKLLYLDNSGGSNGFSTDTAMATVKFKVKDVAPGSAAFTASAEGFGDKSAGSLTANASGMTLTIASPLAGNNLLSSLTVSNATISPVFDKNTISYTAEVPFSVSKLNVSAVAEDGKANVSINSPTLTSDGITNVTVTVTAENGAKKTYTIKVKREKDPNYVPGGNHSLASISVDGFLLSPGFKADVTDYVVWLPYETESVKVSANAADGKANVDIIGGDVLAVGQDNPVKIICTAENGEKKEYTIVIKRAPAHDGTVDEIPDATSETPSTPGAPSATGVQTDTSPSDGAPAWLTVLLAVAAAGVGFAGGFAVKGKR